MICILSTYAALATIYSITTSFLLFKIGKEIKQKKNQQEIESQPENDNVSFKSIQTEESVL